MKFSEFKESVEGLGFKIFEYREYQEYSFTDGEYRDFYCIQNDLSQIILDIGKNVMFALNTVYHAFYELIKNKPRKAKELFAICTTFAETPIDEREDEKKYYLKHKWIGSYSLEKYLNLNTIQDRYFISDVCQVGNLETQFTEKEIEEIKDKFNTNLEDFEWVEVEDEDR